MGHYFLDIPYLGLYYFSYLVPYRVSKQIAVDYRGLALFGVFVYSRDKRFRILQYSHIYEFVLEHSFDSLLK